MKFIKAIKWQIWHSIYHIFREFFNVSTVWYVNCRDDAVVICTTINTQWFVTIPITEWMIQIINTFWRINIKMTTNSFPTLKRSRSIDFFIIVGEFYKFVIGDIYSMIFEILKVTISKFYCNFIVHKSHNIWSYIVTKKCHNIYLYCDNLKVTI